MLELQAELQELERLRGKLHKVFPAYITHIRFPRYKNMAADARIDFTFPITALVGANGSGKTSVLNALYGAPNRYSTGDYWFSTKVDPIEEGEGSPNRFIYGHFNAAAKDGLKKPFLEKCSPATTRVTGLRFRETGAFSEFP
jgi:energy-coupling factor transporter ATP-binding protein EcfA2